VNSAPALVALTAVGAKLGQRIQKSLPGAELHGLATRIEDSDVPFTDTRAALTELFQAGRPIIGICATGILIRMLAPQLSDKQAEPPVLAVSPDGSSVVPLLGGHHGANDLARTVASITGGTAALTTAGESIFGIALDDPPAGWRVANPERAKEIMAALLAGESPALQRQMLGQHLVLKLMMQCGLMRCGLLRQ
jgi:cobalt-precorrin 5A hydrolase/precorrin-3B C17-methyltransferase